jgi:Holliday junction resolvase-like predicted endonuclease
MSTGDIGESLVGAYLRHVEKCSIVTYNNFFAERQGEIDVVGIKPALPGQRRIAYICEVTTHTGGMARVRGKLATRDVMLAKLARLRDFAAETFPDEEHRYQWWSPYVAEGAFTRFFAELEEEWERQERSLEFVVNAKYTARIDELIDNARNNSSTTSEPAYRLLQILTRLRGTKPVL